MTEAKGAGRRTATVTVLFCDLVGSTERQARLGDDANDEFRHRLFAALRAAVDAARGEVVKTIGDAVMAVFRASAVDAVTCAALMHRAVRSLDLESPVRLRIGVSAGEAAEENSDWFGTPVVLAARLEAVAAPEQTLVADVVRVLVGNRGGFEFRDIGERTLKGLPLPVVVAEVIADDSSPAVRLAIDEMEGRVAQSQAHVDPLPSTMPNALAIAAATTMTGRDDELQTLRAAWSHACAPTLERPRQILLVSGEPGIGKSRLVAEFAQSTADSGGHVHYGRCNEHGAAPFLPWITVLDSLIVETTTKVLERLRAEAAELQRLCPQLAERVDLPPPRPSDLEVERARLLTAIERILAAASELVPTLIIVDDLHWADQSSLLLLEHLASVDLAGRFLVVGTYRDTELERSHPLAATLADLRRARRLQRIALGCLERDETAALIALRSGATPDAALTTGIFAETEGNPFFVEEVCAYLLETERARVADGSLIGAADLDQVGIPEGVREVLGRRFGRLSSPAVEALRVAAIMGSAFDIGVLEELLPESNAVLAGVEEATRAGLVRERKGAFGGYEFCHALVRNALADETSAVRRVRLHRDIADTIERLRPDLTAADVDLLVYHFAEAAADGDVTKAAEYACRAAEQAMERAAYDEANAYLERALELTAHARGDASASRAELLITRTDLLNRTAPNIEAMRAVGSEAIAAARAASSAVLFARAVEAWAGPASGVLNETIATLLTEAIEGLGDRESPLQVRLRSIEAFHLAFGGRLGPGHDRDSRALVDIARNLGDWRTCVWALLARGAVLRGRPQLEERRRNVEELTGLMLAQQDPYFLAATYRNRLLLDLAIADRAAFVADLATFGELRAQLHKRLSEAWDEVGAVTDALLCGCFEDADERIERFEPGDSDLGAVKLAQHFWLRAEQGRLDELEETLAGMEAFAETYSVVLPMLAFARARIDRTEQARALLHEAAADDFGRLGRDWAWPVSLAMLAEADTLSGDHTFGAQLTAELAPYRGQLLVLSEAVLGVGAADRYLGMLDAAMHRTDEALNKFAAAYELEARYPAPPLMARTRYWHARTLLTRPGGRAEAKQMLDECIEIAESLGMRDLSEDARALYGSQ